MPTLDQVLDAIEKVESGGNPYARSPAGAMGAYQFMPATAKEYGLTNPYDKRASRAAAERKMQDLLHEYDNDLTQAVAAYNLGQGNLRKVGGDWTRVPETNQYVRKVAAASMAKQKPVQDDEWEDVTHEYMGQTAAPADDEWEDVTDQYRAKLAEPAAPVVAEQQAKPKDDDFTAWLGQFEQTYDPARMGKINKDFIEMAAGQGAMNAGLTGLSKLGKAAAGTFAGAAMGAAPKEGLEEKAKGAAVGAGLAGLGEILAPAAGTVGIWGKRAVSKKYAAADQLDKQLAGKFSPNEMEKPLEAPAPWSYTALPGVKQTAGMLSNDQRILKLEQGARVRNVDGKFSERDIGNTNEVFGMLDKKSLSHDEFSDAVDSLGTATSGMRKDAFDAARLSKGLYQTPLMRELERLETEPGIRGTRGAEVIASKARKMLSQPNFQPEDLYALRKELDDALNAKGINLDDATNAIKGARREAMAVKKAIDESLEGYSGGLWNDYLGKYAEGMRPLNEGKAFQNIIDSTQNNSRLPIEGSEARNITRAGLRRATAKNTYERVGKGSLKDILSTGSRNDLNDAIKVMEDTERARTGALAINGSRTSSDAANLTQQGLGYLLGPKGKAVIDYITTMGASRGLRELDDALLNPDSGKLQTLLDLYQKSKRPPTFATSARRAASLGAYGAGQWGK